jgi:hypothetical protein
MVLKDEPHPLLFGNGDFKCSVKTMLPIMFQFGGNNMFIALFYRTGNCILTVG